MGSRLRRRRSQTELQQALLLWFLAHCGHLQHTQIDERADMREVEATEGSDSRSIALVCDFQMDHSHASFSIN